METVIEDNYTITQFNTLFKYKGKHLYPSIEEKRETFLQEQKEKRHQATDKNRQFDIFIKTLHDDGTEFMECEQLPNKEKKFKFSLMKTEWFLDVPHDLEEKWLVKCVPTGFRVMLVSRNRRTICYSSKKRSILTLKSNFSGGGGIDVHNGTTVLDCIYNKETNTIFVLDCLCWNNMSMIDSDAEFRFFWLKSKFIDNLELSYCKKFKFVLIDYILAHRALIQDVMFSSLQVNDSKYYYDGIVFYHKESHYCFGDTPLVGWLASYMLTELLNIDVSPEHLVKRPEDYSNVQIYIQKLLVKKTKHKQKIKIKCENKMDVL